jgi:hypothetical protein
MRRAQALLVSILVAASTLTASSQAVFAHTGDVWSNSDAFGAQCLGFTDTYPKQLYTLTTTQLPKLGYGPVTGALGSGFTRTAFLNEVFYDYAVYVHSHGDNYWAASGYPNVDSAFLQDPGAGGCNSSSRDMVRSSSIKSATAGTMYNLVIMSTCYLGSGISTMPNAFQIEKVKSSTDPEFYLGYVNSTYDSSSLRFEQAFWSYLNGAAGHTRTLYQAFTYAKSIGGYAIPDSADPFQPDWWGNPNYNGVPA